MSPKKATHATLWTILCLLTWTGSTPLTQPLAAGDREGDKKVADSVKTLTERGNVDALTVNDVAAKEKGTIKWVVEEGTRVKKGDKLVVLDPPTTLLAPHDGIAVYAVSKDSRVVRLVAVGEPVVSGQKLVRVQGLDRFVIHTNVHEAKVAQLRLGSPVRVRIDAFPKRMLQGKITHISTVATQPEFLTRDVKVYPVTIEIADPPTDLRIGMSAEVRMALQPFRKEKGKD